MTKRARGVYHKPTHEPADSAEGFARVLNTKLVERGWTQADLVRAMNTLRAEGAKEIQRQAVSSYLRGVCMPRPAMLRLIATALKCELTDLVKNTADVVVHDDASAAAARHGEEFVRFTMGADNTARLAVSKVLPVDKALAILAILHEAGKI